MSATPASLQAALEESYLRYFDTAFWLRDPMMMAMGVWSVIGLVLSFLYLVARAANYSEKSLNRKAIVRLRPRLWPRLGDFLQVRYSLQIPGRK